MQPYLHNWPIIESTQAQLFSKVVQARGIPQGYPLTSPQFSLHAQTVLSTIYTVWIVTIDLNSCTPSKTLCIEILHRRQSGGGGDDDGCHYGGDEA